RLIMGDHKKKKKKEKKRSRSSSSSSSDSDQGSKFDKRLLEERKKSKKDKKVDKQRMKEEETPEEKRARRLAKKMRKEQKRLDAQSALPDNLEYTNTNNPFNDMNLTQTFVWGKKLEKEGKNNLTEKQIERESRDRIKKNMREMEELKRGREARLAAREDMEVMQRDADRRSNADWQRKDVEFMLENAKVRSRLRIEQNRAKAIDLLARYINFGDDEKEKKDDDDFELEDPTVYLKGLEENDYEDLIEDIKVYISVTGARHVRWWKNMAVIVKDELNKYRESRSERTTVHSAVSKDVSNIFKGKSMSELETLETQMKKKMEGGGAGTDLSYWSTLLDHLTTHMARKSIKEEHDVKLKEKLKRIREEQMKDMEDTEEEKIKKEEKKKEEKEKRERMIHIVKPKKGQTKIEWLESEDIDEGERETRWRDLGEEETERITIELYERGGYEPSYGKENDTMPGIDIVDEVADDKDLLQQRMAKRKTPAGISGGTTEADAAFKSLALSGMEADESIFSGEVQLDGCKELWTDKYRPRKPRYLNRVQTGFDWNKYNQTHYDQDNPPPKIVQGYKFNVFYNDLLDMTKAPTFKVIPCEDPEFAEILFKAGPPYEDIAFKIVNREWEVNHKFGYKCQFQNGVFQLWFQFKRYRYRR
ncbi:cacn-1, partial [Pristionchus pacificus]